MSPFPAEDDCCESCGYPLLGLRLEQACPECRRPVRESHPDRRPGLPWQNRLTPLAFLRTATAITARPRRSFARIDPDAPRSCARAFAFTLCLAIGLTWFIVWTLARGRRPELWAIGAGLVPLIGTYVEALGVTFFSRRRRWRVPWRRAENLCLFAAVGWILPAMILLKIALLFETDWIGRHGYWPIDLLGYRTPETTALALILLAGVGSLWFETLVWLGVRRIRFANRRRTGQTEGSPDHARADASASAP